MASEARISEQRAFLLPLRAPGYRDNIFCLLSQNQVVEILGRRMIHRAPLSPPHLLGMISYFGQILPVLNLDGLCAQPDSMHEHRLQQLVVLRTGERDPHTNEPLKVALCSSATVRIIRLGTDTGQAELKNEQAPQALLQSGLVRGFFSLGNEAIVLLDLKPLVLGAPFGPAASTQTAEQ